MKRKCNLNEYSLPYWTETTRQFNYSFLQFVITTYKFMNFCNFMKRIACKIIGFHQPVFFLYIFIRFTLKLKFAINSIFKYSKTYVYYLFITLKPKKQTKTWN